MAASRNPGSAPRGRTIDPFGVEVGARIRSAREAVGLSLAQAAEATGLSKDFLWRLETGRQAATVRSLAQVARGLGATMSDLLDGLAIDGDGSPSGTAGDRGESAKR